MLDEREKIRRFILGIRRLLYQSMAPHMETYPSYTAMVTTRMMEMRERDDKEYKKKRK